ncbi:mannan endo-1,4-beta-mannosidase 7-like [Bidens hawaiensis]|uniref:mannan endo-1,4-beta-mannosidase 7-like n=1 Tax=Bidens hawaiensis TaxID=980011 RepID=UPI004049EBFA
MTSLYPILFFFPFFLLIPQHWCLQLLAADDGFVRINGAQFMLNGAPFYANGFNSYWLMDVASNPSQRSKVTTAFKEAVSSSLVVARTWAFSDGGSKPLQSSPSVYNENMFQALDFVVSEGGKFGVKLILSLVNNFNDYGGKAQYVQWANERGQQIQNEDSFFTNSIIKSFYKNHIKTILTRRNTITGIIYKDDPTIMAWELMNEPRCPSDVSGAIIQNWISEMACYLKSIDGYHLLEVGLEGFYGASSSQKNPNNALYGTDFIANNQIPEVDFGTVHSYPDNWLSNQDNAAQLDFLQQWMYDHIVDAQEVLQKPIVFAEFGKSWKHIGYNIRQRDQLYNVVYSWIYRSASEGGVAAGGLFWLQLVEGMDSYKDGYEVILTEPSSTVRLITQHAEKLSNIRKRFLTKRKRNAHLNKEIDAYKTY